MPNSKPTRTAADRKASAQKAAATRKANAAAKAAATEAAAALAAAPVHDVVVEATPEAPEAPALTDRVSTALADHDADLTAEQMERALAADTAKAGLHAKALATWILTGLTMGEQVAKAKAEREAEAKATAKATTAKARKTAPTTWGSARETAVVAADEAVGFLIYEVSPDSHDLRFVLAITEAGLTPAQLRQRLVDEGLSGRTLSVTTARTHWRLPWEGGAATVETTVETTGDDADQQGEEASADG